MDFVINGDELDAMCGLPHIQQLAYLRGIRPYMDVKTGLVGIKRRISYQSISEQLYVEPHQGIKSQSFSRDQVRRAISGLVRAGIIEMQSEDMQLILKCQLATRAFSVQNKAAIKPPQKTTTNPHHKSLVDAGYLRVETSNADIEESSKAALPLNSNNYIFLLKHFEQFWDLYPLKNSEAKAWQIFQELNPSDELIAQIVTALKNQIQFVQRQQSLGHWVPNWKNPANWLAQRCWNDVIPIEQNLKENHAKNRVNYRNQQAADSLWALCKPDDEESDTACSNVIEFSKWGR
ncbi:MAG: hypothetical protein CK430_11015 [Legionella sp.]|nr:MAG: hypothetical protein CK430_11015 [Legionella sp.]